MATTRTAQWYHPGLWAALLWEGKISVCVCVEMHECLCLTAHIHYTVSVYFYVWIFTSICGSTSSFRHYCRCCLLLYTPIANCMSKTLKLSRISVSRVPWVDNMFFHCVHSIAPTVLWFLLLMKWIGWPLLQAHSAQCSNLSRCENALHLGGVTSTRLLTHNTSALLSRQPYPTAPMLLQYWPVGFSQGLGHNDTERSETLAFCLGPCLSS